LRFADLILTAMDRRYRRAGMQTDGRV
jgi:hypothetical protein